MMIEKNPFINSSLPSQHLLLEHQVRFIEWVLVALACLVGSPSLKSWLLGSSFILAGVLFLLWARGFQNQPGGSAFSDQAKYTEMFSMPVGPWRYVRHPVILGRTRIMFGVVVSAHSIYILTLAVVILGHQYVRMAEAHDQSMSKSLGPLFASYRLLVPSFIPFFVAPKLPVLGNISPLTQRASKMTWKRSMLFRQAVLREVTGWFVFGFAVFGVSLFVSWGVWIRVVFGSVLLGRTIWVAYHRQVMTPYLKWVR